MRAGNIIDSVNPDILIGSETWLSVCVSSGEFFHQDTQFIKRTDKMVMGVFF